MSKGEKNAVQVMVRVRPFNRRELELTPEGFPQSVVLGAANTESITVLDNAGCARDKMDFNKVFWSIPDEQGQFCGKGFADQEDVYKETGQKAVQTSLSYKHSCIFAYGQTGSGKTYTMLGAPSNPGIAPRIVDELFSELDSKNWMIKGFRFSVEISFMEIYNERVKDLLSDDALEEQSRSPGNMSRRRSTRKIRSSSVAAPMQFSDNPSATHNPSDIRSREYKDLKVRNSPTIGVFVEGLCRLGREDGVVTAEDVKRFMQSGMEHRATAETQMNSTSSRSHAIFQLCLRAKNESKGISRYSNINLVDLAGSERITLSGAEGARLVEATKINLSLSTLRRVIDILIENSQKKSGPKLRPPFRDSTLTWILSESLGGNSVTMMLATVSPFEGNREDTVNTLRYAEKAKSIVNHVRVNEEKCNVLLSAMQQEMENMRQRLQEQEETNPDTMLLRDLQEREEEMKRAEEGRVVQEMEIAQHIKELELAEELAKQQEEDIGRLMDENVETKKQTAIKEAQRVETKLEEKRQLAEARTKRAHEEVQQLQLMQYELGELEKAKQDLVKREELFRREVQLVKRKQFSIAFQKAFQKCTARSGTDLLSSELTHTNERVGQASVVSEKTASESRQISARNEVLQSSIAQVESEIKRLEQRTAEQMQRAEDKLSNLASEKKSEELCVTTVRDQVKQQRRRENALCQIIMKEKEGMTKNAHQLVSREKMVRDSAAKKRELIKQLHEQIDVLAREVQILDRSCLETRDNVDVTQTTQGSLRRNVVSEMEHGQRMRDDLIDIDRNTMHRRAELRELTDTAETLKAALGELTRKHQDLKRYVAHKYFPEGHMDSAGLDRNVAKLHLFDQGLSDIPSLAFDGNRAWVKAGYIYKRTSQGRSCSPSRSHSPAVSNRSVSPSLLRTPVATPRMPSVSPGASVRSQYSMGKPRSLSPSRQALSTLLPC